MSSPPLRLHGRLAALLLLPLLASGCSHRDASTATVTPAAPYAAVARGRIDVEGGLLSLGSPRDGTLATVDVREGDRVTRGQTLASLDSTPARLDVDSAQAALEQARAQQLLLDGKLAAARQRAQRLEAAAKAGAGDGQSADEAGNAVTGLAAEREAARAATDMASQRLAAARYELGARTLKAPIDADVIRVAAQPGASVSPASTPLFILLPQTPPIVRAELNESFAGAVSVGMPATVSADGDRDASAWPAHVLRIGRVVGPSSLDDDAQQRANARTVACVLSFDQPQSLRIGQRVLVRFGAAAAPATAAPAAAKAR
jgi:multidrug resistance efflux pump